MQISDGKSSKSYGGQSVQRNLARFRGDTKNETEAAKKVGSSVEDHMAGKSEHDHAGEEGSHEDIQAIAAEHGPAKKIEVKHEESSGHHHVTSHHEDGHVHESAGHPSVPHVRDHISASMGEEPMPGAGAGMDDEMGGGAPAGGMGGSALGAMTAGE
jgi:hypothetical protein